MDAEATAKLVRELYGAYVSGERRVQDAALADDFTFTSAYDDHIDRSTYFARCWPNHQRIKAIDVETVLVNGTDVFVRYTCELDTGERFRNVEYLVFEGAKLKKVEVYFGDPPSGVSKDEYPRFLSTAKDAWKEKAGV